MVSMDRLAMDSHAAYAAAEASAITADTATAASIEPQLQALHPQHPLLLQCICLGHTRLSLQAKEVLKILVLLL